MWFYCLWKGLRVIVITTKHLKCFPYFSRQEPDYSTFGLNVTEWNSCPSAHCLPAPQAPWVSSISAVHIGVQLEIRFLAFYLQNIFYVICGLILQISKRNLDQLLRQLTEDVCRTESVFSPSWFSLSVFYRESKRMPVLFSVCRFYCLCLLFYNLMACC